MSLGRAIANLPAAALLLIAASAAAATPREPHRAPASPIVRDAEPDTTATIPARPTAPAAAAKADDAALPPPFRLPAASHARMRDCGRKWQAMKMSGAAGDDIWRDFAMRCLAAANGPLEKR